ncbi:MAG: heavy-metal-associated domain-containing protein [Desulfobacteraceae bacterium]|jgi:copper ion binding protein|nr:heavy-metal-associated domain-containing protein [Desulfobacteraceae bacterium]
METKTLTVPNISCHHCTNTIQNELGELAGVSKVQAEVESKRVTVAWDAPASLEKILATLEEINYPAADA